MSFSRMHNEYLDPDRHAQQEMPEDWMESHQAVLDCFSAESEKECIRAAYKYTDCGACLKFTETGIAISAIVEGLDGDGTATYRLNYADHFTVDDIQSCINKVESEASELWQLANPHT